MRTKVTRPARVIRLAVFALLAFCLIQTRAHSRGQWAGLTSPHAIAPAAAAHSSNGTVTVFDGGVVIIGLARGQTVRFTVLNQNGPQSGDREHGRVRVRLFDANGNVISQSAELVIPFGEFRSIDFNRDGISLPGEALTGRLQVRAETEVRSPKFVQVDGRVSFPASVEIVDNSTGATTAILPQKPKEIVVVGSH